MVNKEIVIDMYVNQKHTLRHISEKLNTDHHTIKRILVKNGIEITRRKTLKPITDEIRKKMSENGKKTIPWMKGRKATDDHILKNMIGKLKRPLVTYKTLLKYDNIEKLKFLNRVISRHRKYFDDLKYLNYLEKFWFDKTFNKFYDKWYETKNKWFIPSLDHIHPVSKGGTLELDNLRFISWFENKTKSNMTLEEWNNIKQNINEYF